MSLLKFIGDIPGMHFDRLSQRYYRKTVSKPEYFEKKEKNIIPQTNTILYKHRIDNYVGSNRYRKKATIFLYRNYFSEIFRQPYQILKYDALGAEDLSIFQANNILYLQQSGLDYLKFDLFRLHTNGLRKISEITPIAMPDSKIVESVYLNGNKAIISFYNSHLSNQLDFMIHSENDSNRYRIRLSRTLLHQVTAKSNASNTDIYLATDKGVYMLYQQSGCFISKMIENSCNVTAISCSQENDTIYFGTFEGQLYRKNANSKDLLFAYPNPIDKIHLIKGEAEIIVSHWDGTIFHYQLNGDEFFPVTRYNGHFTLGYQRSKIIVDEDSKTIYTLDADCVVRIWKFYCCDIIYQLKLDVPVFYATSCIHMALDEVTLELNLIIGCQNRIILYKI